MKNLIVISFILVCVLNSYGQKFQKTFLNNDNVLVTLRGDDTTHSIIREEGDSSHWQLFQSNSSNVLITESFYKNDTLHVIEYYNNGMLRRYVLETNQGIIRLRRWCTNGQLILDAHWDYSLTEMKVFYCNGNIKSHFYIKEAMINGLSKSWYENAALREEGEYINDQKVGVWKYYSQNGILNKEELYKDGEIIEAIDY